MILMTMSYASTIFDECIAYRRMDSSDMIPKIVGGSDAKIEDFPFMALLIITVKPPDQIKCGGSYIQPLWVLTAAHCLDINDDDPVFNPSPGDVQNRVLLLMGIDDFNQKHYQRMKSEKLIIHPDYKRNRTFVDDDVGLIKIPTPFNMTNKVQVAPIPATSIDYSGQYVFLTGWGRMNDTDEAGNAASPTKLQKLKTTVLDMKNCSEWSKTDKVICIGKKGEISCSGDSGGPLIYQEMVIGICSYGFGCSGEYSVYGNAYSYRKWIEEITEMPPASATPGPSCVNSLCCGSVLMLLMIILKTNNIII
ncbi:hypothetical protein Trydic_g14132 [Trypoxylus dichotomus]